MPDLSTTGGAVRVLRWLVEVGQAVRRGEPLMEVETDKATVVVESVASGTLRAQAVRPDDEVSAGQVIAAIDAADDAAVAPPPRPAPPAPPPPASQVPDAPPRTPPPPAEVR